MKKIIKLIKLINKLRKNNDLFELVDKFITRYDEVNEYCKKKEWKVYDNIHKTLNVLEEAKKNEVESNTDESWYIDRAIDVSLKTYIISKK